MPAGFKSLIHIALVTPGPPRAAQRAPAPPAAFGTGCAAAAGGPAPRSVPASCSSCGAERQGGARAVSAGLTWPSGMAATGNAGHAVLHCAPRMRRWQLPEAAGRPTSRAARNVDAATGPTLMAVLQPARPGPTAFSRGQRDVQRLRARAREGRRRGRLQERQRRPPAVRRMVLGRHHNAHAAAAGGAGRRDRAR